MSPGGDSALRIGLVYPELLGTYGDRGNALVLVSRARRRGIPAELVEVPATAPLPAALDVYLLGGGEDAAEMRAAEQLRASSRALERAWSGGAVVFAVCAGFQLLGSRYDSADGPMDGLGLVDVVTVAGTPRLVGEVLVQPDPTSGLPLLTGFENHSGRSTLGPGEQPLGTVVAGEQHAPGTPDGVLRERLAGTYLHGPALPRNPALADRLLTWALGVDALPGLDDELVDRLRAERIHEAKLTGWRARWRDIRLARG